MWSRLATIILRGRLPILIALAVITASMATRIDELGIRYKFGGPRWGVEAACCARALG